MKYVEDFCNMLKQVKDVELFEDFIIFHIYENLCVVYDMASGKIWTKQLNVYDDMGFDYFEEVY